MERKDFIKKSLLGGVIAFISPFSLMNEFDWDEEIRKCKKDPNYFYLKYCGRCFTVPPFTKSGKVKFQKVAFYFSNGSKIIINDDQSIIDTILYAGIFYGVMYINVFSGEIYAKVLDKFSDFYDKYPKFREYARSNKEERVINLSLDYELSLTPTLQENTII